MPELPEIETIKNGLTPEISSQVIENIIIRQNQLRWKIDSYLPKVVKNQTIKEVNRRGKYLLFRLNHGTIIIHLGMSGSLTLVTREKPLEKHDHVDFYLKNGSIMRYNDPRRFGAILWTDASINQHRLFKHLGPEPLSCLFNKNYLYQAAQSRKTAIKKLIMNSHIVVGVGNIYANEALFKANIHPITPANEIKEQKINELTKAIKSTLRAAIKSGGTTLKDFKNSDGKPGYFKQKLFVYGRRKQPCLLCNTPLEELRIDSRSTVYCPSCQS